MPHAGGQGGSTIGLSGATGGHRGGRLPAGSRASRVRGSGRRWGRRRRCRGGRRCRAREWPASRRRRAVLHREQRRREALGPPRRPGPRAGHAAATIGRAVVACPVDPQLHDAARLAPYARAVPNVSASRPADASLSDTASATRPSRLDSAPRRTRCSLAKPFEARGGEQRTHGSDEGGGRRRRTSSNGIRKRRRCQEPVGRALRRRQLQQWPRPCRRPAPTAPPPGRARAGTVSTSGSTAIASTPCVQPRRKPSDRSRLTNMVTASTSGALAASTPAGTAIAAAPFRRRVCARVAPSSTTRFCARPTAPACRQQSQAQDDCRVRRSRSAGAARGLSGRSTGLRLPPPHHRVCGPGGACAAAWRLGQGGGTATRHIAMPSEVPEHRQYRTLPL